MRYAHRPKETPPGCSPPSIVTGRNHEEHEARSFMNNDWPYTTNWRPPLPLSDKPEHKESSYNTTLRSEHEHQEHGNEEPKHKESGYSVPVRNASEYQEQGIEEPKYGKSTREWLRDGMASRNKACRNGSRSSKLDRTDSDGKNMLLSLPVSIGRLEYTIETNIGMEQIDALPDTGAQVNTISARLAERLGLQPKANTEKLIRLPTGSHITSPGRTEVPFSFSGEDAVTDLDCFILSHCTHDLILSGPFLRATETLTKYKNRIVAAVRKGSRRLGLRLLGNEKRRLHGLVNGEPVQALPDTGSDIMAISEAYALSRGFDIDRDIEHYLDVEFADGSEGFTCGLVRGVDWTFAASQQSIMCDFYVLEDLCTDVVLNSELIFGLDVFSAQSESLSELPGSEDCSELLLISLKSNSSPNLPQREDVFNIDLNSPDAFNRQRVLAELNYRDEVDDLIDALDPDDQEAARRTEIERRRVWEELRQRHQQLQVAARLNGITSPMAAPTQDTNTATSKRRRWAFRFRIPSLRAARKGG